MGTLYQGPPPPPAAAIDDLRVKLEDSTLVFPYEETEKRSMFLSNIDQVLLFNVETVHFFAANPDFPIDIVKEKLKLAFSKVMVPYDFLAGRLSLNHESGRFEFDCNGAGAGFVLASTEFSLDEIGDLVYPNPAFRQLVTQKMDNLEPNDQPLAILQVTSFKCGGFAMGFSTNHATFDGLSFKTFLENLASQAFDDKPLAVTPSNDRHLLSARSPPIVKFPHEELLAIKQDSTPPVFDCSEDQLDFKIFRLTSSDINNLKEKAKPPPPFSPEDHTPPPPTFKITGFNVVTAHVWRCKALSYGKGEEEDDVDDLDRVSTVLYAVDIRSRLKPPLPGNYAGNAVLTVSASAKCRELQEGPFSKVVELVSGGAAKMTDEYARSAIDWGALHKGFPHGEFLISSWWRLGFDEVVYPWGKPRYSCPVVYHRKDIILLFPDIGGIGSNNGVNVLVALPPKEMERFQSFFHKFLA